jgi:hypothetical protein
MSDTSFGNPQPWQAGASTNAGPQDVVTQLKGIVQQLTALVAAITGRVTFGTFAFTSTVATLTVTQPGVKANSVITITPTDASAGTLQGSAKALYVSAIVPGTSFTVATASGGNAAGTESFAYTIMTPT